MSKQSKRPGRASRHIHQAIQDDLAKMREVHPPGSAIDAADYPEVDRLMTAVKEAIEEATRKAFPNVVRIDGRPYWVAAALGVKMEIFANPGDAEPLVRGLNLSLEVLGHRPGH